MCLLQMDSNKGLQAVQATEKSVESTNQIDNDENPALAEEQQRQGEDEESLQKVNKT